MEVRLSKRFAAAKMLAIVLCNIELPGSLRHSRIIIIIIIIIVVVVVVAVRQITDLP